jgi:pyridoxal 5'-phosphate synthase pdxT subunit
MKKIGVLTIQGDCIEHLEALRQAANGRFEIVSAKTAEAVSLLDGLIIPGGESTTIGKLAKMYGVDKAVKQRASEGMAVWGTCAGAILIAKELVGAQTADIWNLMDITVERNAYGRQLDSFETELAFEGEKVPAIFIRAPKIASIGKGVEVLARHEGEIVMAREKNLMITTFHPELTDDIIIHSYFLKCVNES